MIKLIRDRRIKNIAGWFLAVVLVFVSIGFADKIQDRRFNGKIIIKITNQFNNYFIDENDLLAIIYAEGLDPEQESMPQNPNLGAIEKRLEAEWFISDAQIFRDLMGNLIVVATQRRPIARIIRPDAPDAYISEEGTVLPVSEKFTSRVMLVSGEFTDQLVKTASLTMDDQNRPYFDLIRFINADPFWKAQISQLEIAKDGKIKMYPQVTKQVIEFGLPEDIEIKFRKLNVFYMKILPFKGWNYYHRVSLEYKDQIVCE